MGKLLNILVMLMISLSMMFNSTPCSCECDGDCTFKPVSDSSEFVALVKVVEYSDYIKVENLNDEEKMPLSMIVEVIEKYKGSENRKRLKIWGDDGALCRPYIEDFTLGSYYLIAPRVLENNSEISGKGDYDFFLWLSERRSS